VLVTNSRINITIQARKIDVDFRGDYLVASKRTTYEKRYSLWLSLSTWFAFKTDAFVVDRFHNKLFYSRQRP